MDGGGRRPLYGFLTPSDGSSGLKGVWRGFTDTSTSHGVPHIRRVAGIVKRGFWGLITAVCVSILIYHLTTSCILYFSHETAVNVALVTRRQLTFPAVTICNLNPVKQSAVFESSALSQLINDDKRKRKKRENSALSRLINDDKHTMKKKKENSAFSRLINDDKHTRNKRDTAQRPLVEIPVKGCSTSKYSYNYGVSCFWMPDDVKSEAIKDGIKFGQAKRFCENHGGFLAAPSTEQSLHHINNTREILEGTDGKKVWIWLLKDRKFGDWEWRGETATTYTAWDSDYPGENEGWHAYISRGKVFKWRNQHYDDMALPLCERRMTYCPNAMLEEDGVYICYWLPNTNTYKFEEALDHCKHNSGHLAIVDTERKAKHLLDNNVLDSTNGNKMWIWLQRRVGPFRSTWVWGDRKEVTYSAWVKKYPFMYQRCGYIKYFKWRNTECNKNGHALCEIRNATGYDCPHDLYRKGVETLCYIVVGSPSSFNNMVRKCKDKKATMAVVDTPEKLQHINETNILTEDGVWISLLAMEDNGALVWKWEGEKALEEYEEWEDGYPRMNPSCTYVKGINKWYNERCNKNNLVMCERRFIVTDDDRTTTMAATTQEETTTLVPTTTQEETTTLVPTTTQEETTTVVPTTTQKETTTVVPTTTQKEKTTVVPTTTQEKTTTVVPTKTQVETTTVVPTTTQEKTTTVVPTTTQEKTTTVVPTTTQVETTTVVPTTTQVETTTVVPTTIPEETTTELPTTVEKTTTTTVTTTTTRIVEAADKRLYPIRLPLTKEFVKTNRILEVVADLPISSKQTMGYSALELILDCEFAGSKCDMSEFSSFYDTQHGNCYIFNSNWNKTQSPLVQQRAGTSYGLSLTLNIGQYDYIKDMGGPAGARIVVHPQDRMPFPKDEGVLISPGQMTIIGIRQLNVVRLPEPYGNCTDTTERNIKRSVFEEVYPVGYSVSACYATCYQRHVIERCGCADSQYPMEGAAFDYKRISSCNSNNATQDTCRYHVSIDYAYNRLECDCPLPCEETAYTYQTSSSIWPSDAHKETTKQELSSQIARFLNHATDDELWNNLLKVKVYFEEFNYENIEETPAYSTINFASDIGGILGLWIGCSIISLFEFFELSMDVVVVAAMRMMRRRRGGNSRPGTLLVKPTQSTSSQLQDIRFDHGKVAENGVTSSLVSTIDRQRTLQRHGASPMKGEKATGQTSPVLSTPDS